MRSLGFSLQRPQPWKQRDFLAIAKKAEELGSTIVTADESGRQTRCVSGHPGGIQGGTPAACSANSRFRLNRLAAISPEGELRCKIREGRAAAETFREFPARMVGELSQPILVVADNCSIRTARKIREWLDGREAECEIHDLPQYAPEVNPVELPRSLAICAVCP